jgi:hypothetical protein
MVGRAPNSHRVLRREHLVPPVETPASMRLTEFWARMDRHLGPAYSRTWAETQVLSELGGRTVVEALDQGENPKTVWRAVWAHLQLPASER